ncbi:MAG: DUF3990 domain-containing protein [Prevotellaceae bacterium]|jgi:hypothetical protein|nr:DUF3990 domain-containing protein [Prevotellaceae bacterium]
MRVYHGSYTKITEIDLSLCEPQRDFGKGFYVTKYLSQAEFWAFRKGIRAHSDGVVTAFEFDENAYIDSKFKVLYFETYNDEWFDFVIKNRKSRELTHDYDIIEGPVADDKIQRRLQRFLDGEITREQFFKQLTHPTPSHQICFCTLSSLQMLKTVDYEIIINIEDIGEKVVEKLITDFGKLEKEASEIFYSSDTFSKLSDYNTRFFTKPWQEIYEMLKKEIASFPPIR